MLVIALQILIILNEISLGAVQSTVRPTAEDWILDRLDLDGEGCSVLNLLDYPSQLQIILVGRCYLPLLELRGVDRMIDTSLGCDPVQVSYTRFEVGLFCLCARFCCNTILRLACWQSTNSTIDEILLV